MKRILVTGGGGLIGRHALPALRALGFDVRAVGRREADLHDAAAVEALLARIRPTHLLHLAWITTHGSYWTSPENDRWVESSLQLVRRFHESGGRRAVIAGTCAEYDWSGAVCSEETTRLAPTSRYGRAKDELRRRLEAEGVPAFAWGRIFFTFGPGEQSQRLVPSVASSLLRGTPAACTHGRQVRDYLYAGEVASAFAALAESDITGPVNVASGCGVELRILLGELAELAGRPDLLRFGALEATVGEAPAVVADTARLKDEVGWRPATTLRAGLARTLEALA
ncbi:MAG: NAD-dependent epimerase/dehydratase family protein [Gaiellaceae bacterium]